jgi:hypothetical protein
MGNDKYYPINPNKRTAVIYCIQDIGNYIVEIHVDYMPIKLIENYHEG